MTTVINHPLYAINAYEGQGDDGETMFDWNTATGNDSDEWFESAEEAKTDVELFLGLTSDVVVLTKAEYDELLDYKFRYEGLTK